MKNIALLIISVFITSFSFTQQIKRAVPPKIKRHNIPEYLNPGTVVFKILETESTDLSDYSFYNDKQLYEQVTAALEGMEYTLEPLFMLSKGKLLKQREKAEKISGNKLPNLSLYYRINLYNCTERQSLDVLNEIHFLNLIETAYFPLKTEVEAAPDHHEEISLRASPDFSSGQKYLEPAPAGIDALYAWGFTGGKGLDIRFCDVERDGYRNHEELLTPAINDVSLISGYSWGNQHGTATMSEVIADHDGSGINGIAPDAEPYFSTICANISCSSYSQANGIAVAADTLRAGDVMLLEMQTVSPYPFGLPQEYDQASFDAIQIATSLGIAVVEAGGNGSNNLDSPTFNGAFDTTVRYSGAFIIGAANADTSVSGATWPPRGRAWFSSFGNRIDFFAWGEMVTAAGYGDLYGSSMADYYTATFSGTSSASPIVTGAVAVLQGIYKAATNGNVLPLDVLRDILKNTGTPSFDPPNDKIGVMPDLKAAIDTLMIILSADQKLKPLSELQVNVYPNPACGRFTVRCSAPLEQLDIRLYNVFGQMVFSESVEQPGRNFQKTYGMDNQMPGVYFLELANGEGKVVKKIILQ